MKSKSRISDDGVFFRYCSAPKEVVESGHFCDSSIVIASRCTNMVEENSGFRVTDCLKVHRVILFIVKVGGRIDSGLLDLDVSIIHCSNTFGELKHIEELL